MNAIAPLLGDAKERIAARHAQNVERGRDLADSRDFAVKVLAPIADAADALGIEIDPHAVADSILRDGDA